MDSNLPQQPPTLSSSFSLNNLILVLLVIAIILILGLGGLVYLKSKNTPTQTALPQKQENKNVVIDKNKPKNYIPTTVEEKKMAENLKKYGLICKRFTSLDEALKNPDIACTLDLSGQKLKSLPSTITTLQNLNEVNLSNNQLTTFPTELLSIKGLIALDLSNNQISSIPEKMLIPSTIQSLNLTGNKLKKEDMYRYQRYHNAPIQVYPPPSKK